MAESISQTEKKSTAQNDDTDLPPEGGKRRRHWNALGYPNESLEDDWRDILDNAMSGKDSWVESPLHDKDIKTDGTPKKPHYHVELDFENDHSYEQVKNLLTAAGLVRVRYTRNARAMIRYMAHLDNPEKYQYSKDGIIGHGVDVEKLVNCADDINAMEHDLEIYVREHKVSEYAQLVDESWALGEEYHKCVVTHTIHFKAYIGSIRWGNRDAKVDINKLSSEAENSDD